MDYERGEVVCAACGEVVYSNMPAEVPKTVGTTPIMHDRGLSTIIGSPGTKTGFERMVKWDRRGGEDVSLIRAFTIIRNAQGKLSLPDNTVWDATTLYRKVFDMRITRGRTIQSLAAVCIYIACRKNNVPRTMQDISKTVDVDRKSMYRDLSVVRKKLDITIPPYDIVQYVVRVCNNLQLTEKTKRKAIQILHDAQNSYITAGKHPGAMAAGSIYLATLLTDVRVSQRDISRAAGVTDVTLRNTMSALYNLRSTILGTNV